MGTKKNAAKRASAVTTAVVAKHPKALVQEALQTTFVLKGTLKRVQLMYMRVGVLLVKVRDQKLYAALNHPDMESYARERLGLGRSSLHKYLRIHEWVSRTRPEWLKPKAVGFIPDLSDVGDLMWLEAELAKRNLSAARRAILEDLRQQGLAGKLRRSDVRKVREPENTVKGGLQQVISRLRQVRKRAAALANMSPEVLAHLDAAIQIMRNDNALQVARLDSWEMTRDAKWHQNYSA
jgi:hypothetical protein